MSAFRDKNNRVHVIADDLGAALVVECPVCGSQHRYPRDAHLVRCPRKGGEPFLVERA